MDRYPTEAELEQLRIYAGKIGGETRTDIPKLIAHLRQIWYAAEMGIVEDINTLELHTFGWSGNEEIISELEKTFFWLFYWQKSLRGGHHYFEWRKCNE